LSDITIKQNAFDPETERQYNEIASVFAEGFVAKIYSDGIIKNISMEQLQNYLANPDNYINELANFANYQYISNGEVFQLFDLAKVLPTLNHKIDVYEKSKNYEKNLSKCNKVLNTVKFKQLTRGLISQLVSTGTVTGIWIGDAKKPYLYVFENVKYFYPDYRLYGNWVVSMDLSYLNYLNEGQRNAFFKNLYPYITKSQYEVYLKDNTKNKVELPQDRTICLRTHTLKLSQPFGINWSTTGLYDIEHKKKLKDLEKAIANKIISAVAVLTIGSEKTPDSTGNLKLNKDLKKKIYSGVKAALEKNQNQGVTVVGIPEFANLEFPDMKSDALQPEKFNSINNDITSAFGTSSALLNGTGANFASAKINLEIFYKRLGVLLEDIETEVFDKLFQIILSSSVASDFKLVFDKEPPISLKDKIDFLFKLHSEGFAVKPILDCLSGVSYEEYISQSIYELETMKLPEKIKPYQTAFTNNGSNGEAGNVENDGSDNPNTIVTKQNDGNKIPES